MKRLFGALKIDPDREFLEEFRAFRSEMNFQQIKWVEEHNIHITLKFFGETEEGRIPEISDVLRRRASMTAPLKLRLEKTGIFGSRYDPRVIWIGIEPYREVAGLMKLVHEDLRQIGFEPDRQNLVPHLTLGRVKLIRDRELFARTMEEFREIGSEVMTIGEMRLYESVLNREGPRYTCLERFGFK